jgi:hypothetical protein
VTRITHPTYLLLPSQAEGSAWLGLACGNLNFNLQPTTTMTTPHKLVKLEGATYFIGKCRAGDYVIHSWNLFGRNDG